MWCPTIEPPELSEWVLSHLLEAMVRINVEARRRGYSIPPLYQSAVRYQREPRGAERWQTAPWLFERGRGDCEDLACARAAVAKPPQERVGGGRLFHIVVDRGGSIEDPSRKLGM
jgi:hypothetical protein